jgi:serine/threonine-protein kinase
MHNVCVDAADLLGSRYRLLERLGEGGMSVVWRAHDEVLDRMVAVKVLSSRLVADPASRRRIRAEAQAAARLTHPHIAGVYDYGESGGEGGAEPAPYIVMELLSGPTLTEMLDAGPMTVPHVLRVCAEVATALADAHEQDIVHRDVKPANVMMTAKGAAKVVDFGVAAVIGDLGEQDAVLFGTPAYVAPERLEGGPVVTGTDVYGLGVLMYRMLAGYMPWPAETTTQMLIAHMYVEPDPLPPLTGLPADVIEVCQACLQKEPEDRPAAAEVAAVLTAAAATFPAYGGSPETAGAPSGADKTDPAGRPPSTVRRRLAVAGAAAAVIAAAVILAAFVRPGGTPPAGSAPIAAVDQAGSVPGSSPGSGGSEAGGTGGSSKDSTAREPAAGAPDPAVAGAVDPRAADAPTVVTTTTTGAGPAGGNPPAGTTPPSPVERSASESGNTVTVRCVGAVATIIAAVPAEGWSVTRLNAGPAEQVNVKFESATVAPNRLTYKIRCNGGVPRINLDTA